MSSDDERRRHADDHAARGDTGFTCPGCRERFDMEEAWKAHRALHLVMTD